MTVTFGDLSTGTGIDGWSWTFGDGGTSTDRNPNHTYNNPGTYTVSLTVSSSSQGCDDTMTRTGYITVNGGPTAGFVGSPTSGTEPLAVSFTNQSTDATSYLWDFGDSQTSTAVNPNHTYNSAGTYTVTLTATNACGSDDEIKVNYITVNPCVAPVADFAGNPTSGELPLAVSFTNQSSDAASYLWDFGDSQTSTAANPNHTYMTAGTYTVTLTATNSCGSDDEVKVDYITVTCTPPTAAFSGTPTSGDAPLVVDFSDVSTGATSWSWNFGDGGTATTQNPSYTYTAEGTYTVVLTVSNACGSDMATMIDYITVTQPEVTVAYANADISVTGTVTNDYTYTFASDNSYEVVTEELYTGHPRKRYSYLEHKWTFNFSATGDATFYLEAYRPGNTDGDDFIFAYSTDDAVYNNLVTVAGATEQTYSAALPSGLSGTLYIRALDSDRSWYNTSLDPLYVDQMYIDYSSTPQPPVADFSGSPTSGNYPLEVGFTDLSTGNPDSWNWDFGDGGTATVQHPTHTYNTVGTYTVALTVGNAQGNDTETKIDYITVTEPGDDYMYVYDMVVGRKKAGPNYFGTCTVTIYDNNNSPVPNATVYVTATGPIGGDYSGVTASDGTVEFQTNGMKRPSGEWCFEVTNVTHTTLPYDAAYNNVTKACESGDVFKSLAGIIPAEFAVVNYPNPFNPVTSISMSLPTATGWSVTIYNIAGQRIREFSGYSNAGIVTIDWDASRIASGIYFYKVVAGENVKTAKMLLMK